MMEGGWPQQRRERTAVVPLHLPAKPPHPQHRKFNVLQAWAAHAHAGTLPLLAVSPAQSPAPQEPPARIPDKTSDDGGGGRGGMAVAVAAVAIAAVAVAAVRHRDKLSAPIALDRLCGLCRKAHGGRA
jgi:hypothetical protein